MELRKIDVAEHLLGEAVLLFFKKRDPVCIHSLAHASHEILYTLSQPKKSVIRSCPGLTDQTNKEIWNYFSNSRNFFKHADKDPDKKLCFNPESNKLLLLSTSVLLHDQFNRNFIPSNFLIIWLSHESPNLFNQDFLSEIRKTELRYPPPSTESILALLMQMDWSFSNNLSGLIN